MDILRLIIALDLALHAAIHRATADLLAAGSRKINPPRMPA